MKVIFRWYDSSALLFTNADEVPVGIRDGELHHAPRPHGKAAIRMDDAGDVQALKQFLDVLHPYIHAAVDAQVLVVGLPQVHLKRIVSKYHILIEPRGHTIKMGLIEVSTTLQVE